MWKLHYSAPHGHRVDYRWLWVIVPGMWYNYDQQKWIKDGEPFDCGRASTCHVKPKSIKAFMRYLKKHPELKGHRVIFVNRWYSPDYYYDVEAVFE